MDINVIQPGMVVFYVPPHAKGDRRHKDVERGTVVRKSHYPYSDIVFVLFAGDLYPKGCHAASLK